MKQLYLTLLLVMAGLLAGIQTVKAQKVVLHMAGNQKAEYSTQQLDSITFVDADSPIVDPSTEPSITGDAIDITNKSATLIGYATSIRDNLANDLRVGFIYCLEGTPSKNNGTQITVNKNDVSEDGRYTATIENLLSNATYYFRSFVYQSGLWFYGKVKSFITEGIDVNFTTGDATAITCFSAKVSGSVNVKSSYSILEYGICYGTGIEPTIDNNKVVAASENFTLQLRQLTGGTDYYYRPYIIVDGQTCYGTVRTFRTLDDNIVETGDIDEETLTVTSHLTIGSGAYSSLVLGVCYGKTETPTVNDKTVTSDEVDDENNYTVTLVSPGYGTIYYRAYILIDGVPHYGAVKYFEVLGPNPKVRVAIYETIPGYSVKNVRFYTSTTTNTTQDNFTMFAITSNNYQTTIFNFGPLNYTVAEYGERIGTEFLGRASNAASFAGDPAKNYYVIYLPNESGTNLNLRVDYTLESTDGSGEEITVKGATAQVPGIYTTWKPGFAYTYLFKISDKTNGHTGVYDPTKPDDTTVNSDPASLFPITLDAVIAEDGNDATQTIIVVSTPSITTYQKGSNIVNNNEYLAANGPIYVTVNDGTTDSTPDLANGALQTLTGKAALYTIPAGKTEAEVIDALQMQDDDAAAGTIKGRSGLVLTEATLTLTNSVEYGVDGNAISVGTDQAAKFTASAGIYAFVYTKTVSFSAGTNGSQNDVVYYARIIRVQ